MTAVSGSTPAHKPDFFDRLGAFVGDAARKGTERLVDRATVLSPAVLVARGLTDPEGTKESFKRVGKDAFDAMSILSPAVGITRAVMSTKEGREAVKQGAKGAVEAATVTNPAFAVGRAIVDPEGTKETFGRVGKAAVETGKVVEKAMDNPFTGYGQAKRAVKFAQDNPEAVEKAAKVGFDILTITNPGLAMGRGIAEGIGSLFGRD